MHLPRSRLLYKGIGIFFQPEIIVYVGGRASAQFLQQIHYFITSTKIKGTIHQDNKWIYQTIDQWAKILGYSTSTIKNCIRILQNLNLIKVEKLSNYKSNRTNFYTINYGVLNEVLKVEPNSQSDEYILPEKNVENDVLKQSKIAPSTAKKCLMVNTKSSNKELNNKSEDKINISAPSSKIIVPLTFPAEMNQAQQVKIKKLDLKKEKTSSDTSSESHSLPKTTVAQDMLTVWNNTFERNKASMSKQLAPFLVAAYKNKFDADMLEWKKYCLVLASSQYLTGDKFNLSLLWALKYATIDRINNHEFGVKEVSLSTYSKTDALNHISKVKEVELCKEVRRKLLAVYGENVYKNWFEELHLELINNQVCFKAKNNFINDYVQSKFGALFSKRGG